MPQGIAMPIAYWEKEKSDVTAVAMDAMRHTGILKANPQDIQCHICKTPVQFVRSHILHKGDDQRERKRAPHFRLRKEAHTTGCKYTALGQITEFVGKSRAVRDIPDAFSSFEDREGGFNFRLNLLRKAYFSQPRPAANGEKSEGDAKPGNDEENRIRRQLVWNDQILKPFISAALDIAALYKQVEDSPEKNILRETITLQNGRETITWPHFIYDPDRYRILYGRLTREKYLSHPAALVINPHKLGRFSNGDAYYNCQWDVEGNDRYTIQLVGPHTLLSQIKPRQLYVVFGEPTHKPPTERDSTNSAAGKYFGIRVAIYTHLQFAPLTLVESDD